MHTRNSTRVIAPGLQPYRLPPTQSMAFSPATVRRPATIGILSRRCRDGRLVRASLAAIKERLGAVQARVVLCGHSHQQHFIQLPDGTMIVLPGRRWLPVVR